MKWCVPAMAIALSACNGAPVDSPADPVPSGVSEIAANEPDKPDLALFTSLPIFWAEGDIGELLSAGTGEHWAKGVLTRQYDLEPIDRLTMLNNPRSSEIERLLMAQPRALAPDENVALDAWVRSGGRLLLLADPMLEAHSEYGLGDPRRPEAIAMLSPILARWGLELSYDASQPGGRRMADTPQPLPIAQAGTFRVTGQGHEAACEVRANGLIARCKIGDGAVLAIADATLLEDGDAPVEGAEAALHNMLQALDTPF